ncbi:MAG: diguanylate cyclase [Arcobacteraceae bacterium]|nr:diguanylate cyclase [Arcobacteraceae bacterium]
MNKEILKDIVILYVEDEEDVREFTSKTLEKLVKCVKTANNGLAGLETFIEHFENPDLPTFDIIITDINMPKMNGLDMLVKIYEIDSTIPSVITTAHNDVNFLKKAIDLGVRGYATKPLNLFQLLESISMAVESRVLRKQLENTNKELEKQVSQRTIELQNIIHKLEVNSKELLYEATHDHLTSIYNRQKFTTELDYEIKRANRYNNKLSIIMYDIDSFKNINDTYGHDIGDEVLIAISNLSTKHLRNVDILARWGGEEFMILLPQTTIKDASRIAENIRKAIEKACLSQVLKGNITASFGVCEFIQKENKDTFLKRVDEALYKAKNSGKNIVVMIPNHN